MTVLNNLVYTRNRNLIARILYFDPFPLKEKYSSEITLSFNLQSRSCEPRSGLCDYSHKEF